MNVVTHALAGHDCRVSGPFDARPQMRKEVTQMKRAVTSKKAIAAALAAATALAFLRNRAELGQAGADIPVSEPVTGAFGAA